MNKLSLSVFVTLAAALVLAVPAGAVGVAPTVSVSSPAANGFYNSVPALSFTVTGTGVSKACTLDGPGVSEYEEPCTSPYKPLDPLADGSYSYVVSAENSSGSDAKSVSFTIDRTAPSLMMLSGVTDGIIANAQTASYKLSYSDANLASVTCKSDDNAPSACGSGGIVQISYSPLADGQHTFTFTATDKAGNSTTLTRTLTIDTVKPTATINLVGGGAESKDNTPAFQTSGSDANGPVTKQCRIEDQLDWTPCAGDTWVVADGVADGLIIAWVAVSDRAGNTSYASYSFTLDSTMPSITYGGFAGDRTTTTTPDIEFWIEDAHEASAKCAYDAGGWDELSACDAGSGHAPAAPLVLGAHTFWISVVDSFGNVGSTIYTFDVVAPQVDQDGQGTGGQGGGAVAVAVKATSSKVKRGKFTLTLKVTAANAASCGEARVVVTPKLKKSKPLKARKVARASGGKCVATIKLTLKASLKAKRATVAATHGDDAGKLTIRL